MEEKPYREWHPTIPQQIGERWTPDDPPWTSGPEIIYPSQRPMKGDDDSDRRWLIAFLVVVIGASALLLVVFNIPGAPVTPGARPSTQLFTVSTATPVYSYRCIDATLGPGPYQGESVRQITQYDPQGHPVDAAITTGRC